MRHAFVRATLALAAVVALTGCGDANGPHFFERTYALQRVGDAPLPYVWPFGAPGETSTLVSQTLRLSVGDRAVSTDTWRIVVGDAPPTITSSTTEWRYSIQGSAITLTPVCAPNANCIAGLGGTITDAGLTLSGAPLPDARVWVYQRAR